MKKIIISMIFIYSSLLSGDKFYGIEILSELKNMQTYELDKVDKKYPNMKRYSKKLENDYFDRISIRTNLNNIIYQIRLTKNNLSEAQKVLNKLQKKYGTFSCSPINTVFGKQVIIVCV